MIPEPIVTDFISSHLVLLFFSPSRRSEVKPPLMTLERAVNMLTQDNDESLIRAAGYIRSQCFKSADAKKMVRLHRIKV